MIIPLFTLAWHAPQFHDAKVSGGDTAMSGPFEEPVDESLFAPFFDCADRDDASFLAQYFHLADVRDELHRPDGAMSDSLEAFGFSRNHLDA